MEGRSDSKKTGSLKYHIFYNTFPALSPQQETDFDVAVSTYGFTARLPGHILAVLQSRGFWWGATRLSESYSCAYGVDLVSVREHGWREIADEWCNVIGLHFLTGAYS